MKILDYEFSSLHWKFSKVDFQNINLIVGDSGSGKTRLLNTIFNLGTYVAQGKLGASKSNWKTTLSINGQKYFWDVTTDGDSDQVAVLDEKIYLNDEIILSRIGNEITYLKKVSPKLTSSQISISLLKEEDLIKPLYEGFAKILRRNFFSDASEKSSLIYDVNAKILHKIGKKKDLHEIYRAELGLNPKLYLLSTYFPNIYQKIISYFQESFPFITGIEIKDSGDLDFDAINMSGEVKIFCVREANVDKWIRLDELSSGMKKTLLILTDLLSSPPDSIYLIDEYENSLGVSAINALPNVLFSEDIDLQIFITSHHPYIIPKFPVENWYIAHRTGSNVTFEYGDDLVKKYSVSSQDKYIQLLNDPFYTEGIK